MKTKQNQQLQNKRQRFFIYIISVTQHFNGNSAQKVTGKPVQYVVKNRSADCSSIHNSSLDLQIQEIQCKKQNIHIKKLM
jgi:hypothetical protein